ncbi:hypothetical protein Pcinc_010848 [Petrolisthes cinctipes]|uniref:Uncharacterized protein n=1 Tax=Petrolisthes cinctipes TaxID=88211 RepID=A0AAE1KUZ8_PETCI|nr:hypothetical protein Pcinc_010848 [Petrolisthes cinctipes]
MDCCPRNNNLLLLLHLNSSYLTTPQLHPIHTTPDTTTNNTQQRHLSSNLHLHHLTNITQNPTHPFYTSITQLIQSLTNNCDTISNPQPTPLHQWTTPSQQTPHSPYFPPPT